MTKLNKQGSQVTGRTEIALQPGNMLSDAGGRLRASMPSRAFDSKNITDRQATQWQEIVTGVGASITDLPNEAAVALEVGTASGERVIRQSDLYIPYVPGRSQQIQETFVMCAGKTNLNQLVGFGDDLNMLAFVLVGTELNLLWRRSTTGSPVDVYIPRSEWNGDKLDGDGDSNITIDTTKIQFFFIDFLWQGAGSVRFGFLIDEQSIVCHTLSAANDLDSVFLSNPTLPVRYEIWNDGITASSSILKEVCTSVSTEGGSDIPGLDFSQNSGAVAGVNGIRATSITRIPIFAIRLKNLFNGQLNRKTLRLTAASAYISGNDTLVELVHIHDPTTVTATWADISTGDSATEYSRDITAITGGEQHTIDGGYIPTSAGNKGFALPTDLTRLNKHGILSQNFDSTNSDLFVIFATTLTGAGVSGASLGFKEFE